MVHVTFIHITKDLHVSLAITTKNTRFTEKFRCLPQCSGH